MDKMLDRFLKYVSFRTTSDPKSETCPTTPGQLVLGKALVEELHELGLTDAFQDKDGYVYARLKGNTDKNVKTIGFISHMDTSPDLDGKCINPQIIEEYKGGDIRLNDQYALTVKEFPFLKDVIGHKLVTTDGTTLLGADDKSGITIIMTTLDYLIHHPEIEHGDIAIAFTPDEEIGRGADRFDVAGFGADFAYTVDGGPEGELQFENFNAASVEIHIQGKNVHPGSAKNIMVNALRIAMEIDRLLPVNEKPEYTEGYEGFYLLDEINGTVDEADMAYIIRDHFTESFEAKKAYLKDIVDFLNKRYGNVITLKIEDSYYNMRQQIEPHMEIIDLAEQAMKNAGVVPKIVAIRGGTDGAQLSYKGLPCPNLFVGGYNFHGRFEFASVTSMEKGVKTLLEIVQLNVQ